MSLFNCFSRVAALAAVVASSGLVPGQASNVSEAEITVESKAPGHNAEYYQEISGKWLDSRNPPEATKSQAPGLAGGAAGTRKYLFVQNGVREETTGPAIARFNAPIQKPGLYEVFVTWPKSANVKQVTYAVRSSQGEVLNQKPQDGRGAEAIGDADRWISLGKYPFEAGKGQYVELRVEPDAQLLDPYSYGQAVADAVKFVRLPESERPQGNAAAPAAANAVAPSPASGEWTYVKSIPLEGYTPLFLAITPDANVAVATINSGQNADLQGNAEIPVILIANPLSEKPSLHQVCTNKFPAKRGYSGIAVDQEGNFFVSADTGEGSTSWIRKFRPDGSLDPRFGNNGEIAAGVRFLGLGISGKYLAVTASFAKLRVYTADTGREVGAAPFTAKDAPPIRDICIDPAQQRILGIGKAGVWEWSGGTLTQPGRYKLARVSEDQGPSIAGEGIYFDAASRKVLFPFQKTGTLVSVDDNGTTTEVPVVRAGTGAVVDAVLLADGATLFVSDARQNQIHVMQRSGKEAKSSGAEAVAQGSVAAIVAQPAKETAGVAPTTVDWLEDHQNATEVATRSNKPLLVYVRSGEVPLSLELEKSYLSQPAFAELAKGMVCCRLDATQQSLLVHQLGIFRVPHFAVFSSTGEKIDSITRPRTAGELESWLNRVTGRARQP